MTKDENKGIQTITYNHMNLAEEVVFTDGRKVTYTYTATGKRIQEDFFEAYAPVVKWSTIRTVLAVALHSKIATKQAHLQGFVEETEAEEVFTEQLQVRSESSVQCETCL